MQVQETIELNRDCLAATVPTGQQVLLPNGTEVGVVQALGGSFTILFYGRMFRIDGADADALGKEPLPPPELPAEASDEQALEVVMDLLRGCYDPEIPINIVDLGLVYRCDVTTIEPGSRRVEVDMTLTAPGCGMGDVLAADIQNKLSMVPTIDQVQVEIVFDPPWHHGMMTESARLQVGVF